MPKPNWVPRVAMALSLLIALTACYPLSSKYPLGGQRMDNELIGTWLDEDGVELTFIRQDRKRLRAVLSSPDEDDFSAHYLVRPSRIEGKTYMSITAVFPKESIEAYAKSEEITYREAKRALQGRDRRLNGYYLGYYTITKEEGDDGDVDRLAIYLMDSDSEIVAADLEAGKISGGPVEAKTEEGDTESILFLTSSAKKLTSYVASYGDTPEELFDFDVVDMVRK